MAFIKEKIPQVFLDSFDMDKLFVPYGKGWPIRTWTYDKERDVAWIPITTDSNVATDEGRPTRTWYTMILEGHVIGVLAEDGGEELPNFDSVFDRPNELITLENTHFHIPESLKGREHEVIQLATEAYFHALRHPSADHERTYIVRAELRGISINGQRWEG